ncbi:hypothetical protein [Methylovirgula ligni]|nr:hypothetical protein [Methylovirgula ligni]
MAWSIMFREIRRRDQIAFMLLQALQQRIHLFIAAVVTRLLGLAPLA